MKRLCESSRGRRAGVARIPAPVERMVLVFAVTTVGFGVFAADQGKADRQPADLWFPVGEELVYRLYWGIIPVGKSRVRTFWRDTPDGRRLVIRYRTTTNRLFDRIYPVDDFAEAVIEPQAFLPDRFTLRMTRRRDACDQTASFDFAKGVCHWHSRCAGSTCTFAIKENSRDLISLMYYLRTAGVRAGERQRWQFAGDRGLVDLGLAGHGIEEVDLPLLGRVPCLRVEPQADFGGFLIEDGKVTAWISNDDRRLCTRLTIKAPLARVRVKLCQVFGPGEDYWTEATGRVSGEDACRGHEDVEASLAEPPDRSVQDPP